jgi:hypothetical protein
MTHLEKHRRCPSCGSDRLYPSRRGGSGEKALAGLGGEILRCHGCRARACWFGLTCFRLGENAREGSLTSGLAVAAGCLLGVALVCWVVARVVQLN